jgi:hypothetical protein
MARALVVSFLITVTLETEQYLLKNSKKQFRGPAEARAGKEREMQNERAET